LIYKGFRAFSYFFQSDYYAALFAVIHRWWLHWWLQIGGYKIAHNYGKKWAFSHFGQILVAHRFYQTGGRHKKNKAPEGAF